MSVDIEVLKKVHWEELTRFIYVPDKEQFGVAEYWMRPDEIPDPPEILRGDCDDFALACRKHLRKLGIKSRLVFCRVETGDNHLVCSVDGFILDNRMRTVKHKDDIPYEWLRISGEEPGEQWHYIKS